MGDVTQSMLSGSNPGMSGMPSGTEDLYGNDILSQYLGGPTNQQPQPQPQMAMPTDQQPGMPMMQSMLQPPQPGQYPAPQTDPEGIDVTGWKPHKRTTLGTMADIVLALLGAPIAPFKHKVDNENMQEAMEGFTKDPENTIRRIARFNPKMALELQEKYTDNTRQQGTLDRQNNVFDMQKEQLVYNRIAGMMGGANKDTWDTMRNLALAVGKQYNVDVTPYVPEQYDPDSIPYIRNGAIKPLDQKKLQETHDYHVDTIDTRQRGQNIRHGDAVRGQDLSHGDRVTAEAGRNSRHTAPAGKPAPRSLMTKYGPGIISKDGTKLTVNRGGKNYGYIHTGKTADGKDNWTPVGEVELK